MDHGFGLFLMKVTESWEDLLNNAANQILVHKFVVLVLIKCLLKVASRDKLHDNVQVFIILEKLQNLRDIRMIRQLNRLQLTTHHC